MSTHDDAPQPQPGIEGYLDQMEQLLAEARPMPFSASVVLNRKEFDELLAELREHLPEELRQSRWVIKEREEVLAAAREEAERLQTDARAEQQRLVSETEVVRESAREAERLLAEAREQARTLRLEAEDYVDGKLANFEIVLHKTLRTVERGRERLRGHLPSDVLRPADLDDSGPIGDVAAHIADGQQGPRQLYDYESEPARD